MLSLDDPDNYFGLGTDISTGDDYKLVFTFDPSTLTRTTTFGTDELAGNGGSAALTINNITYLASGGGAVADDLLTLFLSYFSQTVTTSSALITANEVFANPLPGALDRNFSGTCTGICQASAQINDIGILAVASLNVSKIEISATPIPATLPLFVSALGGLGFIGWRNRKAAT